jgi:SpoVK/Ycf46/Vps4 family AAA+-type ATPase
MNQTDEALRTAAIDALRNAERQTAAEAAITDLGYAHYANGLPDFGIWVRLVAEDIVESDYKGSLPDFHKVYEKASRRWQVSQILPSNADGHARLEETKAPGPEPVASSGSSNGLAQLLAELNSYIGLDSIKREVETLVSSLEMDRMRRAANLIIPDRSLHMAFVGNPGTGKTTIARLIGRIYKELGVLRQGQLVCTDRAGLIAEYIGHTALKVEKVVNSSLGGVLFIDEAYSLAPPFSGNDFGQEAIQKLLLMMENHRNDFVVTVAGYPEEMGRFLDANPGLRSRFTKTLWFHDYTPGQLVEIFKRLCKENQYTIDARGRIKLESLFSGLYSMRDKSFGNGRLARNVFEESIGRMAQRVVQSGLTDPASLMLIKECDIPEPVIGRGVLPPEKVNQEGQGVPWVISPVDAAEERLANIAIPAEINTRNPVYRKHAKHCDICGCTLEVRGLLIDGRVGGGLKWANMCADCFNDRGVGIGCGKGQLYARQPNGDWRLVAGFPPEDR